MLILLAMFSFVAPAFVTEGRPGEVSGRSVGAAALSLFIWPGLGQLINENPKEKRSTLLLFAMTILIVIAQAL